LFHEIVVELHQYLTSGHDHMVSHMATALSRALGNSAHTAPVRHDRGAFRTLNPLDIAITERGCT
jgi:hypothetical protein